MAAAPGVKVARCCRRRDVSRYAEQISTNTFGNEKGATVAHAEVEKWCKSLPRAVVEELMLDANDLGVSAVVRRAALRSCQSTGPSSDPQENEARACRAHRRLRGRPGLQRVVAESGSAEEIDLGVCDLRDVKGVKRLRRRPPTRDDQAAEVALACELAAFYDNEPPATSLDGTYGCSVDLPQQLKASVETWRRNGAVPVVLQWIAEGYNLHWLDAAPDSWSCGRNHEGARVGSAPEAHLRFLRAQMPELVKMGALRVVSVKPRWVSPLNVVPKSTPGKFRMILDLRELNSYLSRWPFKMETLKTHRSIFRKGRWMVGVDLKSAYHHVGIRPEDQSYFGCEFDGVYYEWTALCFGLSSAPFAFTKCMRQLTRHFRTQHGFDMVAYLDDFVFVFDTEAEAKVASPVIRETFREWGLMTCPEKSTWTPAQSLRVLGFMIDLVEGTFVVPEDRRAKIVSQASQLLTQRDVPVREVASVAGRIASCQLVLGHAAVRYCRGLFRAIETRSSWRGSIRLSTEAREELQFWVANLGGLKAVQIHASTPIITLRAASDASDVATGAWLRSAKGMLEAREDLSLEERETSSTLRELLGIERGLRAFGDDGSLDGETVQWRTDSQAAFFALRRGSGKQWIDVIVKRIHAFCVRRSVALFTKWVPRTSNEYADYLSKLEDDSDWRLDSAVFAEIAAEWGPFDVDRFASRHNALCSRFNARWYCRDAEAVDAFTQNWHGDNNWVNPPFALVGRALDHMRMCGAVGSVLVPCGSTWAHLPWHTRIFGPSPPSWLLDRSPLPLRADLFSREKDTGLASRVVECHVVRVDFSHS